MMEEKTKNFGELISINIISQNVFIENDFFLFLKFACKSEPPAIINGPFTSFDSIYIF